MKNIEKRWDDLPIHQRIAIAQGAGVAGRAGSSSWADLHRLDKEAILRVQAKGDRPLVDPHASALKQDEQLKAQQKYDGIEELDASEEPLAKPQDYLLWVGWGSYPTIKSFLDESRSVGVSRRISKIPNGLKLGESKIFLAHDEGESGDAVIFAYFVPTKIEMITFDGESSIPEELRGLVTKVTIEEASLEELRGCGYRQDVGALYLVSGDITEISPYRDYNKLINPQGRRFRGIKKVDGLRILSEKAKHKSAPSIRHKIKESDKISQQKGDKWTEEELDVLRKTTSEMRLQRAFREVQKITGRSIHACEYQYRKKIVGE